MAKSASEQSLDVEDEPPSPEIGSFSGCASQLQPLTYYTTCSSELRPLEPSSEPPSLEVVPSSLNSTRRQFKKRFFPGVSDRQWNDWRWQIANRVRSICQMEKVLTLAAEEKMAMDHLQSKLPMAITPYYLSLFADSGMDAPLRRTVVPIVDEFQVMPEEADDPLGEEHQSPVPGLIHRYPDRVLFLALDFCSTYCRYCTRSRVVGRGRLFFSRRRLEQDAELHPARRLLFGMCLSRAEIH